MNTTHNEPTGIAPGPQEKLDIHIAPESFAPVADLLSRYGDICKISSRTRKSDTYLINNPDMIKHVLLSNQANYLKGVGFERVKLLLGNGIIVSDGAFWRRQRRMIQPAFHKTQIEKLSHEMQQCNQTLFEIWDQLAGTGERINLTRTVSELSLQIILRALFGDDLHAMTESYGENPFSFFADDTVRDLRVAYKFREISKLIHALVEERQKNNRSEDDLLSSLINARDQDTGKTMTVNEIVDEVKTMIVAGHETSAGTLNWAWYLLSQHAEQETRLHNELDSALTDKAPNFDDIPALPFTRQIIEEALRLYPPVWMFTRKAITDDKIGGYKINKGDDIFISPYYLHRNTNYWSNPEQFDPERFNVANSKARHRFAFIPFSVGPRRCIGDIFGIIEMQLHIGLMAQHFVLEYAGNSIDNNITNAPIELEPAINLRSKQDIMMKIKRRR